jgi:hypothetical protein
MEIVVWTYDRPRWVMRKSTRNNVQQAYIQTVTKVVEVYTKGLRHPDIWFICCSGLLPCNCREEVSYTWRVEVLQITYMRALSLQRADTEGISDKTYLSAAYKVQNGQFTVHCRAINMAVTANRSGHSTGEASLSAKRKVNDHRNRLWRPIGL